MTETVEIFWSRRAILRIGILNAGVGALGVPLLLVDDGGTRLLGGAWLGAFGLLLLALLRKLGDCEAVIRIDRNGLFDRRATRAPIDWSAIAGAELLEVEHMPYIGIAFHDPQGALRQARLMVRLMAPVHGLFRMPALTMSTSLLDAGPETLLDAIARFTPDVAARARARH